MKLLTTGLSRLFTVMAALIALVAISQPIHATTPEELIAKATSTDDVSEITPDEAFALSNWLLLTPIVNNEEPVEKVGDVLFKWILQTGKIGMNIKASFILALVTDNTNTPAYLIAAFFAAEIVQTLSHKATQNDRSIDLAAMKNVLTYYRVNRKEIGNVAALDSLVALPPDSLNATLEELYDKE